MNNFLAGFTSELVKLSASRKNPYSKVQNQQDKLLRGNLSDYVGTQDVRNPAHPPMYETSNRAYKVQASKLNAKPPKPPKVK